MSDDQGAIGLVNSKFTDAAAYSNTAFNLATGLLSNLSETAVSINVTPIDTNINLSLYDPAIEPIELTTVVESEDLPDAPEPPEFKEIPDSDDISSEIEFRDGDDIEEPEAPALQAIPNIEFPSTPVFTATLDLASINIDEVINAAKTILASMTASMSTVGATLLSFITAPTQAIGTAVVTEMTNAALQKIDDDFERKYTEVATFYSSRGWNLPTGMEIARTNEIDRFHSTQRSYVERDVLIKNFELSQQNFIASMQTYIQYTQTNNALLLSTMQLLYDAAKYINDYALARFNAFVSQYMAQSEVYKTTLNARVQEVMSILQMNQGLLSQYGMEIQGYTSKIAALTSFNTNLIAQQESKNSVFLTKVQGVSAHNGAQAQKYSADVQTYDATIRGTVANLENSLKSAQLELSAYSTKTQFELAKAEIYSKNAQIEATGMQASISMAISQTDMLLRNATNVANITAEIAKASATIAAQLAASSLSAVSAGATIGYHTNANYDETKDTVETRITLSGSVT